MSDVATSEIKESYSKEEVFRIYTDFFASSISNRSWDNPRQQYRESIKFGRNFRDHWVHTYPILPGALITFTNIATSRKWLVIGKPTTAARAVHRLNNSFTLDREGILHRGFEQLFDRMCYDWLTVGRAMLHSSPIEGATRDWTPYEYIDPAYTLPVRVNNTTLWEYRPVSNLPVRRFGQDEIYFIDNVRVGHMGSIIGRAAYLIPLANLAWLILQHDTLQLDGRKLREIFIVKDGMLEGFRTALAQYMSLASGENPAVNGFPIMEARGGHDEVAMEDLVARIGLSEVPREFTREQFESLYVKAISSVLGLPLGQLWNDSRGTNRSLEQVQQERSTLKGPSYLVRSFCRMINSTPAMGNTPNNRAVLDFEEETDNSSLELRSKALKNYVEAIEILNTQFPDLISPKDWLESLYREKYIPPSSLLPGYSTFEEYDLKRSFPEGTSLNDVVKTLLNTMGSEQFEKQDPYIDLLDKGSVVMSLEGSVLEYRPEYQIGWSR